MGKKRIRLETRDNTQRHVEVGEANLEKNTVHSLQSEGGLRTPCRNDNQCTAW